MYKVKVLEYFGTITACAEKLGIKPQAISQWGDVIPEKQAYRIERMTQGALSVDQNLYKKAA